jgi:hypothetical protein
MPIEDVDYLKKHSKKQSYVFLVDSAERDRAVYPTPSAYTMTFTTPFNNVIGLEVIDASIPRTQYNIDINNNTLVFMIHDNTIAGLPVDARQFRTVTIKPGDYSIQTLLPQLNAALASAAVVSPSGSNVIRASISAETESNPPEITNIIRFRCPYPFVFDMKASTMAESLGFHQYTQQSEAALAAIDQRYLSARVFNASLTSKLIGMGLTSLYGAIVYPPANVVNSPTQTSTTVLIVGYPKSAFADKASANVTRLRQALAQEWNITADAISAADMQATDFQLPSELISPDVTPIAACLVSIKASVPALQSLVDSIAASSLESSGNRQLYHSVDILDHARALGRSYTLFEGPRGIIDRAPLPPGTQVAQSFTVTSRTYLSGVEAALAGIGMVEWKLYRDASRNNTITIPGNSITGAAGTIQIFETDGTLSPAEDVPNILLTEGNYWIVFSAPATTVDPAILYNDIIGNDQYLKRVVGLGNYEDITIGTAIAVASIKIITSDEYHTITAPGTYNLIGERYTIMRCPEIEENSYRSLAYSKHFLGLAMFRLGLVGISDNNVGNNINIPAREFHPIGKLSKLSFRFETTRGQLYDFKGVNHTVTLALHYLEANPTADFKGSILNPNYTGNFLDYMYTHEEQEGDSDDQEEDYSRDILMNYRVQEARHVPEAIDRIDREALFRAHISEDD